MNISCCETQVFSQYEEIDFSSYYTIMINLKKNRGEQKNSKRPAVKFGSETTCIITVELTPDYHHQHTKVVERTVLSPTAVTYFTSTESNPFRKDRTLWNKLTKLQRLERHLVLIADGKPFTYEIVD